MSISTYELAIVTLSHMLKSLDNIVSKAEAHASEKEIEPSALLQARLFPDMRTFIFQIQVTTDMAKSCAARLTGSELPKWPDDEQTFADVHARIKKAIDFLATFKASQFEGAESRKIQLKIRDNTIDFNGESFVLRFVLPNFYFHMTTAYNLLRHNGVEIGKKDFLGAS